jgi:hypothetical protein
VDVLFLGMLLWLAGRSNPWTIVGLAAPVAFIDLWMQLLIALHLLGPTLVLMTMRILLIWRAERKFPFGASAPVVVSARRRPDVVFVESCRP